MGHESYSYFPGANKLGKIFKQMLRILQRNGVDSSPWAIPKGRRKRQEDDWEK